MRFLAALFILVPVTASAQNDLFTPHHITKLRTVTEAVIAPDGKQVAYVLSVPRDLRKEKDGSDWTELHIVDMESKSTPLIPGAVNVGNISWTPDGKAIAFLAKRENDSARCLYAIGTRGGEARKLLTHETDILGYSFSGNGNQLAFLATQPTSIARRQQQKQGFNQEIHEEDQPFVRVFVCSLQPDGMAERTEMLKLNGSASEVHFHPKDDKIAVALAPTPSNDAVSVFRKVHVVNLGNGRAANLGNRGKLGQIAWSPDGKLVAMIAGLNSSDPKEGRLFLMDAERGDGVEQFGLSRTQSMAHFESFAWKNSRLFWSQGSQGVSSFLGFHSFVDGKLASHYSQRNNEAILSNITVSNSGMSVAMIAHHPTHPPEVYLATSQKIEPRRLTESNPWLKRMRFARQEVVRYTAGDGLQLEGILIRPLNEEKGKHYPLVLTVHDGPAEHYSNGWLTSYNALGQVAAAKGMAVFYPNYRGSTGYGAAFSMKGQKDAGGNEFYDLIDGVGHLVETGLVDKKKVGITGGGYGGYATAWGSTYYSDFFAAGVMFAGISDWISCMGTTDTPHEKFLVQHRKWLWDDWDYFTKASPLKYIDKAKTPLLILHGKNDTRINPGQSLEMYRHLKVRAQTPVRLVLYSGEDHRIRRAASRLDYNIRLLQWMELYLKESGGAIPPMEIDYRLKN